MYNWENDWIVVKVGIYFLLGSQKFFVYDLGGFKTINYSKMKV